ncbi:MAG: hypothetical protein AAFV80_18895 [Bacteroidota bacterium]
MRTLFLLFIAVCLSSSAVAQVPLDDYLEDTDACRAVSKAFAEAFQMKEISRAFSIIQPYWPLPENELDELREQTIKNTNLLQYRIGQAIGFEKMNEKIVSDFILQETYVVKYEVSIIRLKYIYYKNDQGWILNALKWDDSIGSLLED